VSGTGQEVAELPSTPGARLRREREQRGLTPQQAAEQLNLDLSVIHALENNDYGALGAPVFAKGHLRKYAALVGLSDEEVLAGYERAKSRPDSPSLVPKSREEMMPQRGRRRWPWVVGSLLLFVLAGLGAAWLSDGGTDVLRRMIGQGPPAPAAEVGAEPDAVEPAAGAPAVDASPPQGPAGTAVVPDSSGPAAQSTTGVEPAAGSTGSAAATVPLESTVAPVPGSPTPPAPGAQAQVALQLRFQADSWVEIYDGSGKAVVYDLGRAGTERTLTAVPPLSVTLGNGPAVTVTINGQPAAVPAGAGGQTVARFRVAADGTLR